MPEGLVKSKRIRAGHRGLVTKRIVEVQALLALEDEGGDSPESVTLKLVQLKLDMKEKLDNKKIELLDMEEEIAAEIEQCNDFNKKVHEAL